MNMSDFCACMENVASNSHVWKESKLVSWRLPCESVHLSHVLVIKRVFAAESDYQMSCRWSSRS